ncbi:hypothetical protein PQQ84_33985, partial [Paraburkholderia strydomiana]
MTRPKLIFAGSPRRPHDAFCPGAAGYRIYATYRRVFTGAYIGELVVVQKFGSGASEVCATPSRHAASTAL